MEERGAKEVWHWAQRMRCRKGEGLWSKVGQFRDRADVETQGARLT